MRNYSRIRKEVVTTYYCACDKCEKKVTINNLKDLETIYKWKVDTNRFPFDEQSIKGLLCPECVEKKRLEDYKSENIYTRTYAGYYKDHPEQFREDALKYFDLDQLPNKDKIFSKAWEDGHSGGYYEVLNCLSSLSELF